MFILILGYPDGAVLWNILEKCSDFGFRFIQLCSSVTEELRSRFLWVRSAPVIQWCIFNIYGDLLYGQV